MASSYKRYIPVQNWNAQNTVADRLVEVRAVHLARAGRAGAPTPLPTAVPAPPRRAPRTPPRVACPSARGMAAPAPPRCPRLGPAPALRRLPGTRTRAIRVPPHPRARCRSELAHPGRVRARLSEWNRSVVRRPPAAAAAMAAPGGSEWQVRDPRSAHRGLSSQCQHETWLQILLCGRHEIFCCTLCVCNGLKKSADCHAL